MDDEFLFACYTARMGILVGMDEAGYGPNYGPLVIAATAWQVVDNTAARANEVGLRLTDCELPAISTNVRTAVRTPKREVNAIPDLYQLLCGTVARSPARGRIAVADSKLLYAAGSGLEHLELGVHAVLRSLGTFAATWSALIECLHADWHGRHKTTCWPDGYEIALPIDADAAELHRLSTEFRTECAVAGVRPLIIRARLVYPAEFNDLIVDHGTKATALSHITVGLLREVIEATVSLVPQSLLQTPLHAVCDKHGARNFYAALLQHHFPEHWIEPIHESSAASWYEWGPPDSRTSVVFRSSGEDFLPTALASMVAKYLRELAMRAFNQFWSRHVPNLRPTAGYPKDARRFRNDIRAVQQRLKIDDHVIWRNR